MGRRVTQLFCDRCQEEWWKKFEHMTKNQIFSFIEKTECPDCASSEWTLTQTTRFAGGPIKPNPPDKRGKRLRDFTCIDCRERFSEWIGEVSPSEFYEIVKSLECPACGSQEWELTDGYKFVSGENPTSPSYKTVASETE